MKSSFLTLLNCCTIYSNVHRGLWYFATHIMFIYILRVNMEMSATNSREEQQMCTNFVSSSNAGSNASYYVNQKLSNFSIQFIIYYLTFLKYIFNMFRFFHVVLDNKKIYFTNSSTLRM